jgi:hypothetical protein
MKRSYEQIKKYEEVKPEGQTSVVKIENGKQFIHVMGGCYAEIGKTSLNYIYDPEKNSIRDDEMQFEQKFKKPLRITDKRNDVSYLNSVCYNNQIYCIGGLSDNKIQTLFRKESNPSVNIKTNISNIYCMASAILNGDLYISGGLDHTKPISESNECYKYSFETNSLKKIASLPYLIYNHCMVAYNNKLYISGGEGGINSLTDYRHISSLLYVYDGKCWAKVKPKTIDTLLPVPRYKHSSVVCDDKIYLIGGQSSKYVKEYSNEYEEYEENEYEENIDITINHDLKIVDSYDPITNILKSVKNLPYALTEMTAVSLKIPRNMLKHEILSHDFNYYLFYNFLLYKIKEKGILDKILEYILNEKIYVFKGRSVLSYTPEFDEWIVHRK